jgi:L-fuculose-phosphate aldolase
MHLVIYRARPDVTAIVHTHPLTIGVIGARLDEIPCMFPDQVVLVGTMPCIDYVVPCSPEPAGAVVTAMQDHGVKALLMQDHGLLTIGHTLKEAYFRTEVIGDAARVNWIAASMGVVRAPSVAVAAEIPNLKSERYRQRLRGAATPHPD